MIRPAAFADTPELVRLTDATGLFKPLEIEALQGVLDDYHATNHELGHLAIVVEDAGTPLGYAYYAPTEMTDRTWHLYWIAVVKNRQGAGLGSELLRYVENDIRARGGRLLVIETSSTPIYDSTRRFYLKHGYHQASTVEDFYADGDGMVMFTKRLLGDAGG